MATPEPSGCTVAVIAGAELVAIGVAGALTLRRLNRQDREEKERKRITQPLSPKENNPQNPQQR